MKQPNPTSKVKLGDSLPVRTSQLIKKFTRSFNSPGLGWAEIDGENMHMMGDLFISCRCGETITQ